MQGRGCENSFSGLQGGCSRGLTYANTIHVPNIIQNQEHENYVLTNKDRDKVSGLNDTQWRTLVSLLNAEKSGSTETLLGKFLLFLGQ